MGHTRVKVVVLTSQHVETGKDEPARLRAQLALRDDAIAFLRTRIASEPILPPSDPLQSHALTTTLTGAPVPPPASPSALIVLPGFDWDFRFHRPQYLARHFARCGTRVFFLSTSRYARGRPYELTEREPEVFETTIGSRQAFDVYGGLDGDTVGVLADSFDMLRRDLGIEDAHVLVVFPTWGPLAMRLRDRFGWRVLYDCIDEWEHTPGLGPSIRRQEEALVRAADLTIFTADWLAQKWQAAARRSVIARNGVDVAHYDACAPNDLLTDLDHPVIGYFGTLAARIDVPLLIAIARHRPDATLVIAGGRWDVALDDVGPLLALPNVRYLGERPHDEMPLLLWHFDVCLLPYYVNPATQAGNPVKLYEYLAGGKPVVGTRLMELVPFDGLCYLADTHEQFVAQVDAALEERDPALELRRREVAAQNDWSARYEVIQQAMVGLPAAAPGTSGTEAVSGEPWAGALSVIAASVLERDQYIQHLQAELTDRLAWVRALESEIAERNQVIRQLQAELEERLVWVRAVESVAEKHERQVSSLEQKLAESQRRIRQLRPTSARGRLRRAATLLLGRS